MDLPTAPGQYVTEGTLYRFIPNIPIYWEYDRDRPSPRAFRLRPGEKDGVSMYLHGLTDSERLQALKPAFGICTIRVEELLKEKRLSVSYLPDESLPEGLAHVVVSGMNRRVAEWIAREIAKCLKAPAASVESLAANLENEESPD